ncbi:hypothetical protein MSTO_08320 [Mycobacterium stomatepiae]|uniref:Dehydrogenase E1 component domain-containing protein n=1 Tax=Mycobacterium stomatepiae TaxID=470076 RepID=A0A7I7Q3L1_9MYCO|nr:hypothetical protein MSTO_08320 [Mycobacterium stomatepiae]
MVGRVMPTAAADVERKLYALMVLMKAADDRLSKGIGTGEFMCVYWPSRGQEAIAAAMGVAPRPDDQLVTTYRGLHDLIGKGGTMHIAKPEVGVMLSTGIVGAGPPVAVGLAMAAKRKGLDRVTVVSFGDGATNTGSFHEAANMAALWDLPMVFVCQNNLYAEMTPTHDTMKLERVADRAAGYGMPGVRVDGNDPLPVKAALDEALRRARDGAGPTFVECVTFRFRGHYFRRPDALHPLRTTRSRTGRRPAAALPPTSCRRRHLRRTRTRAHRSRRGGRGGIRPADRDRRGITVGGRTRPGRVRHPDQIPGVTTWIEKEMTMREALNLALDQALQSDDRVFLLGEDIADPGASGPTAGCRRSTATTGCWTRRSRRPRSSVRRSARRSTVCCRWQRS